MPLSSAALKSDCTFEFVAPVTGWADKSQGDNAVRFGGTIDTDEWDQAYAAVLPVAGGGSTTIDLTSFTNLNGEAVVLSAVIGCTAKAVPTVAADDDIEVTIGPGAANGLEWLAGAGAVVLDPGDSFTKLGDQTGPGFPVDGTHKTIEVANAGTDSATVTLVIIGKV